MKKIVTLLLILLSLVFVVSCGEEEEDATPKTETEILEGTQDGDMVTMWKLVSDSKNAKAAGSELLRFYDGKFNVYYSNKTYDESQEKASKIDEVNNTFEHFGPYVFTYELSNENKYLKITYLNYSEEFEISEQMLSDYSATRSDAAVEFINYLKSITVID